MGNPSIPEMRAPFTPTHHSLANHTRIPSQFQRNFAVIDRFGRFACRFHQRLFMGWRQSRLIYEIYAWVTLGKPAALTI